MPELEIHGARIHYEDTGPGSTGETVALSHGLLWSTELFRPQIERLRGRYRVVAWDHRGQGRSSDDPRDVIGMELLTDDALALFDALGLERVHFVGLSMGGFVGMRLAGRHAARLHSLALLDTRAEPEPRAHVPRYRALALAARVLGVGVVAGRVMPILFGRTVLEDPARAADRAAFRAALSGNRRTIWRALNGVVYREGVEHLLPKIRVPTLVLTGEQDVATPPDCGRRIHEGIAGSRFVLVPRAGHSSCVEAPDAVSEALERHLAG
ncbi:MAG: alpha/beta fold hydrolase [Polyangiaceae bacterium]|nr:alpha/beta fold hydrolase [Polyangiaceae bacterium]